MRHRVYEYLVLEGRALQLPGTCGHPVKRDLSCNCSAPSISCSLYSAPETELDANCGYSRHVANYRVGIAPNRWLERPGQEREKVTIYLCHRLRKAFFSKERGHGRAGWLS
jgi:hypothetical protein